MKLKYDYVTNSSSVSFCIYGVYINNETLSEKTKKMAYECEKIRNPNWTPDTFEKFNKDFDPFSLETLSDENGFTLGVVTEPYGNNYYLGRSLTNIGLDQTLREFMAEVNSVLEKMGIMTTASIHEDGWYDG